MCGYAGTSAVRRPMHPFNSRQIAEHTYKSGSCNSVGREGCWISSPVRDGSSPSMSPNQNNSIMTEKEKLSVQEINSRMREGINIWADIMLMAEADRWAIELDYFPRDIMNAVYIFQHVLSNVGIKAGRINEDKAVEFGLRLRELVKDMTGYDPREIVKSQINGNDKQSS